MINPLQEKVAIVTGAGRGLGAAIAHKLAEAGACVAVNDLNPDRAEQIADAIRHAGGSAVGIAADISNKFQCVHLVEATRKEWSQLDILVNSAAIKPTSTILKMDEWAWQRCMDVNLKGTFFMSQLVGRVMADENQDRGGVIVNIASTEGFEQASPTAAAYAASKAGVVGFSRECSREFASYDIDVSVLLPDCNVSPAQLAGTVLALCSGDSEAIDRSTVRII